MRYLTMMYRPTHTFRRREALGAGRRTGACGPFAVSCAVLFLAGCSSAVWKPDPLGRGKVQVQFYTPPGARVTVEGFSKYAPQQIDDYKAKHRLEYSPEEFAVFNLAPRSKPYKFRYSLDEGLPGVSVYGDIQIHDPKTREARGFAKHAFVPIALPGPNVGGGDHHFYPVRGPSGAGLSQLEMEHLRQGDLITKIYFVADLQKAWETIRTIDDHLEKLRSAETVLNAHLEYVDARFAMFRQESLYADPTQDSLARHRDKNGFNLKFITLEAEKQKLENERYAIRNQIDDLQHERRIRTRLLDSMRIVNRQGSLVLATPENQWEFHDPGDQVSGERFYPGHVAGPESEYETGDIVIPPLGEVLVTVNVGGRHMHWGPPPETVAAASE